MVPPGPAPAVVEVRGAPGTSLETTTNPPIESAAAQIEDILKDVRDAPAWSMNAGETRQAVVRLTRLNAQIAELEARVAAHGQTVEVQADNGATSTANWWANATRQTRAGAHRKTRFAAAQATLIAEAASFDAKELRILGKRILDVVAPEVGEAWEARKLAQEEREADAAAVFRMHDDGHGKSHGRFTIPTAFGEMLREALQAIAAPKRRAAVDRQAPEPGRPSAHKMGWRSASTSPATPPRTSRRPVG